MSLRWVSYVALKSKRGLKNAKWTFSLKSALLSKKGCYKVSLYENHKHKSCKTFTSLFVQKWLAGDVPLKINVLLKVNHRLVRERMPAMRIPRTHIQGGPKMAHCFWYALTSSNINRFSNLCHCQNQETMCNNTITKGSTTPQVCRYTTLWNVKCLKNNNWKQ